MSGDVRQDRLDKLGRIDRRWLYLVLLVALSLTLLTGTLVPDVPSAFTRPAFTAIDSLASGQPVLVSLDYSPSSAPEIEPMAFALTRHLLLRGAHPVFVTL